MAQNPSITLALEYVPIFVTFPHKLLIKDGPEALADRS